MSDHPRPRRYVGGRRRPRRRGAAARPGHLGGLDRPGPGGLRWSRRADQSGRAVGQHRHGGPPRTRSRRRTSEERGEPPGWLVGDRLRAWRSSPSAWLLFLVGRLLRRLRAGVAGALAAATATATPRTSSSRCSARRPGHRGDAEDAEEQRDPARHRGRAAQRDRRVLGPLRAAGGAGRGRAPALADHRRVRARGARPGRRRPRRGRRAGRPLPRGPVLRPPDDRRAPAPGAGRSRRDPREPPHPVRSPDDRPATLVVAGGRRAHRVRRHRGRRPADQRPGRRAAAGARGRARGLRLGAAHRRGAGRARRLDRRTPSRRAGWPGSTRAPRRTSASSRATSPRARSTGRCATGSGSWRTRRCAPGTTSPSTTRAPRSCWVTSCAGSSTRPPRKLDTDQIDRCVTRIEEL